MILFLFFSKQNWKVFLCLLKQKYSINYYFYIHFNKKEETYRIILLNPIKKENHPSKFSCFNEFNRIKPKEKEFSGQKKEEVPKETSPSAFSINSIDVLNR